ncbi:MAG: urea carboxylase [Pseudomonadales bacterium]|nr:urea carboxylase [Pseudomonadales bacterium]
MTTVINSNESPLNKFPFEKVLIANRGAIATRIIRTLRRMGIQSVALYSDADIESLHVQHADEAIHLPGVLAAETYLNSHLILEKAKHLGVDAIHPGYGFLSENAEFCQRCENAGVAFIGPTPQQMMQFGLKHKARELAEASGVPLVPGSDLLSNPEEALQYAAKISYPIMLKSSAGGGGIGMQVCWDAKELSDAFSRVKRLSQNNFGNDSVFIEKYIDQARHIEIQVVGDGEGKVVALGERDCSLQRRNQKVIEETPAPNLSDELREAMSDAAMSLAKKVNYRSAGTVEFIFDTQQQQFYFLEMNTRLQVEHGVTEAVTGVDLVEWMVCVAAGETACLKDYVHAPKGHAVQARVYAEDPGKNFQPSSGLLTHVEMIDRVRIDTWIESGITVPSFYDPMLAKVIVHRQERHAALGELIEALEDVSIEGIVTNRQYLKQILLDDVVQKGDHTTRYLNGFEFYDCGIEVIKPGTQTTVQDFPGRVGYWNIGVPPSGPMDMLAFQLANRIIGNDAQAAGLEITLTGPTLKFRCDAVIALSGAPMAAEIERADGTVSDVVYWQPIVVRSGDILKLGALTQAGMRSYLAVKGGFGYSDYLGSKSTFTLGQFGGQGGRALQIGDVLPISASHEDGTEHGLNQSDQPTYKNAWQIAVLYGPHGAPEFFTNDDIATLFATDWEVHFNSSRTGVRLKGPKPQWAREDGGEAGLHPSNIHDNAYAIGAIDYTGDMPVILGPDGPSLGGFVCPVTIAKCDLWKMGQLKPGDTIRFIPISYDQAVKRDNEQQKAIHSLADHSTVIIEKGLAIDNLVSHLHKLPATKCAPAVTYRVSGDDNILVEYGPMELDLNLRFRVHGLINWIEEKQLAAILDLTPGIRSLQIHYDNLELSQQQLLDLLLLAETELPDINDMVVPARIVHLPLSWDDEATRLAIDKYMTTVRSDAPWCPSNIEFIRRINGLNSVDEVKDIVFNARYLVMGLGDVYLGAPVATPLDPRHRLVTTKYNPARTWTPENAVGIGGAYMCVYGMEGPGGYQFVGRTSQMWNRYRKTQDFSKPWLLRFFDQIRFYEVSHDELMDIRRDLPAGRFNLKVEETQFKLAEYQQFLQNNESEIAAFRKQQKAAFNGERERWQAAGTAYLDVEEVVVETEELSLAQGESFLPATVPGSVWQLKVQPGDQVHVGQVVAIVESMKMEFPIEAEVAGKVTQIVVTEGQQVSPGQTLLVIAEEQ